MNNKAVKIHSETMVRNKIQAFLIVGFQQNMASGSDLWQVAVRYGM